MIWSNFFKNLYNIKQTSPYMLINKHILYSNQIVGTSVINFNKSNIIPNSSIFFVNSSSLSMFNGMDQRNLTFLNTTEPSYNELIINYLKYQLLKLFLYSNKSNIEKIDILNNNMYLFSNNVYNIINITNGGLLTDWEYDIF